MKPLKVGLIGAGGIVQGAHMKGWPRLVEEGRVELVAACDVKEESIKKLETKFDVSFEKTFTDYEDMLEQVELDVVSVATPNAFHAPAAKAGFEAGCHVYCEKPLAPTPDQVRELIAARDAAGKKLMTGQHQRFIGKHKALKAFADDGLFGEVYYARSTMLRRRGAPAWGGFLKKKLSGGGPLIDIGVHVLDLTLWMMDFPKPVAVTGTAVTKLANLDHVVNKPAWGGWKRDGSEFDVEDFAVGLVHFENGGTLVIEASFLLNIVEGGMMKSMICGTEGGMDVAAGKIVTQEHGIVRVSDVAGYPEDHAHSAAIFSFIDAIETDKPVPVPAEETLQVMAILDGIYRSQAEGGKRIELDL